MSTLWAGGGPYHEWATFLDRWSDGEPVDPTGLPPIAAEDLTGDSFGRLSTRLTGALSKRLQAWADALTRGLAEARDEFAVARALGHARWGLAPIRELARHPGLPPELTGRLSEAVEEQVRSAQRSLEDGVEDLRRGGASHRAVEARLRTVRDNALSTGAAGPPAGTMNGWYACPTAPARRRVID